MVANPQPRYWTREEYYRPADLGFFRGQRAERIGGQIVVLSPQNWPHASATTNTFDALASVFDRAAFWVRMQLPLELGQASDPEPDVSVVAGPKPSYSAHPTAAVLVVEVSDIALAYDRGEKASLYAAAGVADYWVVDVNGRRVEAFRAPRPDPAQPHGAGSAQQAADGPADAVAPLAAPAAVVPVAGLLP